MGQDITFCSVLRNAGTIPSSILTIFGRTGDNDCTWVNAASFIGVLFATLLPVDPGRLGSRCNVGVNIASGSMGGTKQDYD